MAVKSITHLFRAINWLWFVITLLVFSLLIKLGLWQAQRAEEKEQRLAQIESLLGKEHQPLELVQRELSTLEELNDQPVLLNGSFEPKVLVLLDNQVFNGQLGYRVYQVFYQQHQPLLINLGWVAGSKQRDVLPDIQPLTGSYQLKGHIRLIEQGIVLAEQNYQNTDIAEPIRVQQIELDKLSRLFSKQLLPFVVYLDKNEAIGYKKNWQPIVMPPEKHRGYAFQWFSLATAWLLLMLWAAFKNNNKKAN